MQTHQREALIRRYRDGLLEDVLPFWLQHAVDREHGGYWSSLARDGRVVDTDKAIWVQGRFSWLLATLYATVERRDEWLQIALSGLEFLQRHGVEPGGRLRFLVTSDGRPLRHRRYAFSEAFACLAHAACARATGRDDLAARAEGLFDAFASHVVEPKVDAETRPMRGLAPAMIRLHLAQQLRDCVGWGRADAEVDRAIEEIARDFVRDDRRAVLEVVAPDGSIIDHFDGRTLNPGHAIEAAWFVLEEARTRGGDAVLRDLGCRMLDYSWERGWDVEHGGLLSFVDLDGGEVQEYWHDMKFWWPQAEAIIATLLAYELTGEARYLERHAAVDDWAHRHLCDARHGEWFGYLHRDGTPSSTLKGNHWKGPYHVPRMQWYCWRLLES